MNAAGGRAFVEPYEERLHIRFDEGVPETEMRSVRAGHSPEKGRNGLGSHDLPRASALLCRPGTFSTTCRSAARPCLVTRYTAHDPAKWATTCACWSAKGS
jgi:hypothetical protein